MTFRDFQIYNPSWEAVATALSYRVLFDNDPTSERTLQKLFKEVVERKPYPFTVAETLAGLAYVSEHPEVDLAQFLPDSKPNAVLRSVFCQLANSLSIYQSAR